MQQAHNKISETASSLVKQYRKYGLQPFQEILHELLVHSGSLEGLRGAGVLELGPSTKVSLMQFLKDCAHVGQIRGVGRMPVWPWTRRRAFIEANVDNVFMLDHLCKVPAKSYDIVYSRHVMEQHSIDPLILLGSKVYWRQFKNNGFKNLGEDYPSSHPNVQAIFRQVHRIVKPGGLIVSQIAKKKNSGLPTDFLESLNPTRLEQRSLRGMSTLITFVK